MTKLNVTPGKWQTKPGWHPDDQVFAGDRIVADCKWTNAVPEEREANAALIAEAGTVYHETGLTPRQLADQRNDAMQALRGILAALTQPKTYPVDVDIARIMARAALARATDTNTKGE